MPCSSCTWGSSRGQGSGLSKRLQETDPGIQALPFGVVGTEQEGPSRMLGPVDMATCCCGPWAGMAGCEARRAFCVLWKRRHIAQASRGGGVQTMSGVRILSKQRGDRWVHPSTVETSQCLAHPLVRPGLPVGLLAVCVA